MQRSPRRTGALPAKLHETRPYERVPGEVVRIYRFYLQKAYEALRHRQEVAAVLRESRLAFDDLALSRNGGNPVVGIVGEIYTRANKFSNENAVREIESLGSEVGMPPIGEWFLYVSHYSKVNALADRRFRDLLQLFLQERV